jgi:hypothetical protein
MTSRTTALIIALTVFAGPVFADPSIGLIEICRLPYEHHKEFANIPKGSTFIQHYPRKAFRPGDSTHPSTFVSDVGPGRIVKTLEDAKIAPAPACVTVRAAVVPQQHGAPLASEVPPLTKGTSLGQQFEDPATIAQFKTQVIDGFK